MSQKGQATLILLAFLIIHFFPTLTNATVFAYIPKMENLFDIQEHTIQKVKSQLPKLEEKDQFTIQGYITRWEEEHRKAMNNTTRYLENPINAYTLVRRLVTDLKSMENILIRNRKGYKRKTGLTYPSDIDLKGANAALLHLVFVYKLNITELANGTLFSNISKSNEPFIEFVSAMTANDCFELAQAALKFDNKVMSLAWMKEAVNKYPEECANNCVFSEFDAYLTISLLYADLDEFKKSIAWLRKIKKEELIPTQLNTYERATKLLKKYLKKQKDLLKKQNSTLSELENKLTENNYQETRLDLCFTERIDRNSLTCHYKLGPDPFLRLARLKAETLHLEPEVTMFHDVISDGEISAVQKMAEEAFQNIIHPVEDFPMATSGTQLRRLNCQGFYYVGQIMRHVACYRPSDEWPWAAVARRALDMSGIDTAPITTDMARMYASEYGVGGYHNPHYDATVTNPTLGTVIYYLSEPNQGGATIFTELNLTVFPKKYSAIHWQNLLPNGETDPRVKHAACPVLHGSKWIITKWITDNTKEEEVPTFDASPDVQEIVEWPSLSAVE